MEISKGVKKEFVEKVSDDVFDDNDEDVDEDDDDPRFSIAI